MNPRRICGISQLCSGGDVLQRQIRDGAVMAWFATAVHPLMGSFVIVICVLLVRWTATIPGSRICRSSSVGLTLDSHRRGSYHEGRAPPAVVLHLALALVRMAGHNRSCIFCSGGSLDLPAAWMRNLELISRAMILFCSSVLRVHCPFHSAVEAWHGCSPCVASP